MSPEITPVALIIFLGTIGISLYTMYKDESLFERMLLSPWQVVHENKWYTLITSGFIHADMGHLLFNMITFFFFAFQLESVVGSIDFLIIYFVSLVLSDVSSVIKHKDNPSYRSVGASGAIAGVLFSFILYAPTSTIMIFPIPFPIPSPIFGLLYLAYSFFAARKQADMINHEAHFWGAVSGMAVTVILEPRVLAHFFNSVF